MTCHSNSFNMNSLNMNELKFINNFDKNNAIYYEAGVEHVMFLITLQDIEFTHTF